MRKSYVQIDGVLYEKGTEPRRETGRAAPAVLADLPDFVSPIDRTVVRGRAGMRDHCARHNVVPTAELKGLPTTRPVQALPSSERRADILNVMRARGYF